MKRILSTILILFIFCISLLATEVKQGEINQTISWHAVMGTPDMQFLEFDESLPLDETYLPYFAKLISLQNNQTIDSIQLDKVVLVELNHSELALVEKNKDLIPESIKVQVRYLTDKKEKRAQFSFLPFVYDNGKIKKVLSFSLKYSILNNTNLRSTTTSGLHQYASHSVLKSGTWVKIAVNQTGIYKITYADLVSWGVPNPANARIFGYGGAMLKEDFSKEKLDDLPQVAVWKDKGLDGVFNNGDFLLFYAQGPISEEFDQSNQEFKHTVNPYSYYGYYFISSDAGIEKTISAASPIIGTSTVTVNNFLDFQVYEQDLKNIMSSGREWYGEEFGSISEYTIPFVFPNIDVSETAKIKVDAAAYSLSSTTMSTFLNGGGLSGSILFSASPQYHAGMEATRTYTVNPSSSSFNVTLKYNNNGNGIAWLNYVTVSAYRNLVMNGSAMPFANPTIIQSGQLAEFSLSGNAGILVWNITKPTSIYQMPTTYLGGIYTFLDSAEVFNQYLALNPYAYFPTPTLMGTIANQDLHGLAQTDMVIVTHPDFITQAETLAQKHRSNDGISVIVVTPYTIYNEFSSGTPDASAIRWFMKMFFDRASSSIDAPKYLLLYGDGTYDNRIIDAKNEKVSKLITYQALNSLDEIQSFVTDDYFGLLDDTDGVNIVNNTLDIGIGRFPVSTTEEADIVLNKVINYMDNADKGYWKNRLAFIADDDDNTMHTNQTETHVKYIESNYPDFQPKRIFLDSYTQQSTASGETYPLAKENFYNLLNNGLFLVNYTGHGSPEGLSNEKIINRSDIKTMYNKKLPLFVTATCSFSRFDNTDSSTGEDLLLNSHGGAVGLFTTTRTVYAYNNFELIKEFNKYVFKFENDKPLALGEVMRRTKNGRSGDLNRLNFTLLADPALMMKIPDNNVVVTDITSNSNVVADTIKALSTVTVKGEIQNKSGILLSQFTGEVTAAVYDKKMTVKTLKNEGDSVVTYLDRTNMLFFGKAKVENGLFTFTFMVPKDIAFNYGIGRINLYAGDASNDLEARGSFEGFYVGGSKSDFVFENQGPLIDMYMNASNFKSGQTVDASPVFVANLSDENGINTVGGGIGHDLLLTLNNDANSTYLVNDYYETNFGDYRSGSVSYEIPNLADGDYSLTFRAWDLLNNSSSKTLNFKVKNGKLPALYELYAAPNPAENYVNFMIKHDQPLSEIKVDINVYTNSGSLLWKTSQTVYAEDSLTAIYWDLTDSSGRKLQPGMYLYQMFVQSEEKSELSTKSNKLIVR